MNIVQDRLKELRPMGYSSSGVVIEVGRNVPDIKVGDRVACGGGGYASHSEINYVPKNLVVKLPEKINLQEAAFTTLGAIGLQGIRRAQVTMGETVLVVGLGLIGQIVTQMLIAAGCRVVGLDIKQERIDLAINNGMHRGIIIGNEDAVSKISKITGGIGADASIICAGTSSSDPVNQAFKMVRERGKVVVLGDVGMELERENFYMKEQDFLISRSYGPGRYDKDYEENGIDYPMSYVRWTENRNMQEFIRLISEKKLNIETLITQVYTIDKALEAYEKIGENLGVLLKYDIDLKNEKKVGDKKVRINLKVSKAKENIKVGIIGGGSFCKNIHLPNLKKISGFDLIAIATLPGSDAKYIAKKYNMKYCTTDYHEILNDKEIDTVIITTRHSLHKQIVIDAAQSGKHIFVEKPLALTLEDCEEIKKTVEKTGVLLTIGFNRRYSPFSVQAKNLLKSSIGPKMIIYRVNAGSLPADHWINESKEGGGRLMGEACHFLDLINWFIEKETIEITAKSISQTTSNLNEENNFSSTMKYSDGSIGTLFYSSIGDSRFPKERVEIFCDEKIIVIEDFKQIILSGYNKKGKRLKLIDKGHFQELNSFLLCLLGKRELDLTVEDGIRTCRESLEIRRLLKENR